MKVYVLVVVNRRVSDTCVIGVYLTLEEAQLQRNIVWETRERPNQTFCVSHSDTTLCDEDVDPVADWLPGSRAVYFISEVELTVKDDLIQQLGLRLLDGDPVAKDIAEDVIARGGI